MSLKELKRKRRKLEKKLSKINKKIKDAEYEQKRIGFYSLPSPKEIEEYDPNTGFDHPF